MFLSKVSVIIPVYNIKPQLIKDALDSLLNQTLENIEIIIVNYGSRESQTLEYLNKIKYSNVKIINQENRGLGGARNTGIDNASGEYIGFLDADDWVDKNFYETLYNLCVKNQADIACGLLTRVTKDKQKVLDLKKNAVVVNLNQKFKFIRNGSVCSKIFKKSLFDNLRFREMVFAEDNPVLLQTFINSNKVIFTTLVKYYYRENPISICLDPKKEEKRNVDKLIILKDMLEIIKNLRVVDQEQILRIFIPILVVGDKYSIEEDYRTIINDLLDPIGIKFLHESSNNTFVENIFSVKNTPAKLYKVMTIFGIKFKIKRNQKSVK